ncbi:dioxygenase [Bradyrhizobium sp. CCBAU 51745]|nr:TauD/TfdA family dioxygenase [Bradyrhizobium sp. CCBAU 51745]MDA9441439.1 dioxygenase [Bradyrhizobium sp. CCBAU 51745]
MSDTTTIHDVVPKVNVVRRAVGLGAEIRNVRLSDELSDEVIHAINDLLLEHKVLFFRDQQELDAAEHERLAMRLDDLVPDHQVGIAKAMPSILKPVSVRSGGRADQRQQTVIMLEGYPKICHLRRVINPSYYGDTVWSDMATAYQALPLSLRMFADQLWAVHNNSQGYAMKAELAEADKQHLDDVFTRPSFETEHPVVSVHPKTGKRSLASGDFVQRFVGFQKYTSQKILRLFQSYITAPENTVRWSWQPGDVAIWDCPAIQYHEAQDFDDHHRVQNRATTDRDLPLNIDARRCTKQVNTPKQRSPKTRTAYGAMRSRSSPW